MKNQLIVLSWKVPNNTSGNDANLTTQTCDTLDGRFMHLKEVYHKQELTRSHEQKKSLSVSKRGLSRYLDIKNHPNSDRAKEHDKGWDRWLVGTSVAQGDA